MPTENSELDEFLSTTLARQIKAEETLHNGNVEPRLEMWTTRDPVTVFGAGVPLKSGSDEVTPAFRWVASLFSNCTAYSFELIAAGLSGDLAYTVGFEHCTRSMRGGPAESTVLRVTHVYRRENGDWKIVHRHADVPPIDQSPPAEAPKT